MRTAPDRNVAKTWRPSGDHLDRVITSSSSGKTSPHEGKAEALELTPPVCIMRGVEGDAGAWDGALEALA